MGYKEVKLPSSIIRVTDDMLINFRTCQKIC